MDRQCWYQNKKTGAITSNPSGAVESLALNFDSEVATPRPFTEREMILINDKSITNAQIAKVTNRSVSTIYNKRKSMSEEMK